MAFFVDLSDQRSDIFVWEPRGKLIEWQSHISVRTLSSHFHYLNGPIMWELELLRYTSLFYTQLSPCPATDFSRPDLRPMNAMEAFCLIMIVLTLASPSPAACVWTWSVNVFFSKTTLKTDKITPLYTEISWLLFSLITLVLALYILFSG